MMFYLEPEQFFLMLDS